MEQMCQRLEELKNQKNDDKNNTTKEQIEEEIQNLEEDIEHELRKERRKRIKQMISEDDIYFDRTIKLNGNQKLKTTTFKSLKSPNSLNSTKSLNITKNTINKRNLKLKNNDRKSNLEELKSEWIIKKTNIILKMENLEKDLEIAKNKKAELKGDEDSLDNMIAEISVDSIVLKFTIFHYNNLFSIVLMLKIKS